jgi:hypothetical protein
VRVGSLFGFALGGVDNNPLKYIDPTGHVKVIPADINLENYEIDVVLSLPAMMAVPP